MNKNWTKEQTIVALWLYNQMPFGKINSTNPEIIRIANIIERTPSALSMKMCNLASFDPILSKRGVRGLSAASKMDHLVWEEYFNQWEKLAYDNAKILAKYTNKEIETSLAIDLTDLPEGRERETIVKQRINQSFFRSAILSSYNNQCCITGLKVSTLLEACHIIKWSDDVSKRTDPHNGLCMNTLFHSAYDSNLIGISPDYVVDISEKLLANMANNAPFELFFNNYNHQKITLPDRYLPEKENLDIRYQEYCRNQ